MIQRFYIDTSVIGGVFDIEFEEHSTILMERIKFGQIKAVISEVTVKEISKARKEIRDYFYSLPKDSIEYVDITEDAVQLADSYIAENVVGKSSRDDCLHIAIATVNRVDILVSWNFKHIVNIYRIRGYNSVNIKLGYSALEIRSPKDIVGYENKI
ncbi:MAG: PIN domain protein [Bacteroidia bacterium]|jgi:predicted nucleic acid-binding protein|nr:PIN domain protein [Bacteroidia bacterium]